VAQLAIIKERIDPLIDFVSQWLLLKRRLYHPISYARNPKEVFTRVNGGDGRLTGARNREGVSSCSLTTEALTLSRLAVFVEIGMTKLRACCGVFMQHGSSYLLFFRRSFRVPFTIFRILIQLAEQWFPEQPDV